MSEIQVTSIEANTVSAAQITAGQTTVNSSGLYLNSTSGVINSSAISLKQGTTNTSVVGALDVPWIRVNDTNELIEYQNFANGTNWTRPLAEASIRSGFTDARGQPNAYLVESVGGVSLLQLVLTNTKLNQNNVPIYCSIEAKAATANTFTLNPYFNSPEINTSFDLVNGTVITGDSNSSITPLGDGWYRCETIVPANTNATTFLYRFWYPQRTTDSNTGCYFANAYAAPLTTVLVNEAVNTQIFTANGTWTKPSWANTGNELVVVHLWGGGGGGSSSFGNAGGGGGAFVFGYYKSNLLANTENVVVGQGGAVATVGSNSIFAQGNATQLTACGGGFGRYSGIGGDTNGGGGGGGWFGNGAIVYLGGGPLGGTTPGADSTFGGAAGGNSTLAFYSGGSSVYGGGGGAYSTGSAGRSVYGGGGGASDGPIGLSIYGGNGGNTTINPTTPGGGGAYNAAGANGEVRVYTYRILT